MADFNFPVSTNYKIPIVRVQLVKEYHLCLNRSKIEDEHLVTRIFNKHVGLSDREMFMALMLNTKNEVLSLSTIHVGSLDTCVVSARDVFKAALLANASSIIVSHNHPSGDPTPSPEDLAITETLCKSGALLGIPVLDHVIIGDNGRHHSMLRYGQMPHYTTL